MISFTQLGSMGRLGNQMFQYALLLGVRARSGFEVEIPAGSALEAFEVSCRRYDPAAPPRLSHSFREAGFPHDPAVFDAKDDTDFSGYFQSWRYFEHTASVVGREFSLRSSLRPAVEARLAAARGAGAARLVSVHVRRGDYVGQPQYFHACSPQYYAAATALVAPTGGVFVVCSDDVAWCRAHLRLPGPAVFSEGLDPAQDLALMAACDAHVVANSSFSWWSAWLGCHRRGDGRVVAPDPWFGPSSGACGHTQDLVPRDWTLLRDPA